MRKSTIAKEAVHQLAFIGEILADDNWSGSAAKFHANSANNYIRSIQAVNGSLPDFVARNAGYLKAHGWSVGV